MDDVSLTGVNNYYDALNHMLGFYPSFWWKICWTVTTPLICVVRDSSAVRRRFSIAYL